MGVYIGVFWPEKIDGDVIFTIQRWFMVIFGHLRQKHKKIVSDNWYMMGVYIGVFGPRKSLMRLFLLFNDDLEVKPPQSGPFGPI